jgi:hypothetical protein
MPEREYTVRMVFEEFLGLKYRIIPHAEDHWLLIDLNAECRLIMPDAFFFRSRENWLKSDSLPEQPLPIWNTARDLPDVVLVKPDLSVIAGQANFNGAWFFWSDQNTVQLGLDVLGSAFFMLTRYEEIVKPDRDEHDRFPACASLAYQEGFLDRPIVDEYVEVLWAVMKGLWPGLERKQRKFTMRVSHDVDEPSRYSFLSIPQTIRAMSGDILIRGNIGRAIKGPLIRLNSSNRIHPADPYNTFDLIMDISERYGLISAFYFICARSHKNYDVQYEIDHPAIRHLLRRIHGRGHEIGLHPSYHSYKSPQMITTEADRLRRICVEEGIQQTEWGGRMHFLRWEAPITLYGLEQAGMTYDNTMSYAGYAGFRCGTCHEYQAFDPMKQETVKLWIRPLIAMECTVLDKEYMGLTRAADAYDAFMKLKNACKSVGGTFTLLWHNTRFIIQQECELYEAVIKS